MEPALIGIESGDACEVGMRISRGSEIRADADLAPWVVDKGQGQWHLRRKCGVVKPRMPKFRMTPRPFRRNRQRELCALRELRRHLLGKTGAHATIDRYAAEL